MKKCGCWFEDSIRSGEQWSNSYKARAYKISQQTYHVKEMTAPPPGGLDMNVADEDEFSPDKLRSSVERLYMTVVGYVSRNTSDAVQLTRGFI
jgi:hypothetical protein